MTSQPLRVVSLLPSSTEMIHAVIDQYKIDTGIDGAVLVGRSHECDFPTCYSDVPVLTASKIKFTTSEDVDKQVREQLQTGQGLYSVNKELLQELKPDVVVTQSLCKVCSVDYCLVDDIAKGMDPKPLLVDTNPNSLEDVLRDIERIAAALHMEDAGRTVVDALRKRIAKAINTAHALIEEKKDHWSPPNVAFLEWTVPIFPGGHWTPQLIHYAGGHHSLNPALPINNTNSNDSNGNSTNNITMGNALPSVDISNETFVQSNPDIIIIAPCGLDLPATHRELLPLKQQPFWSTLKAVKDKKVYVVDGNQHFNRPGPRLVDALEWLVSVVHERKDLCPENFPYEVLLE